MMTLAQLQMAPANNNRSHNKLQVLRLLPVAWPLLKRLSRKVPVNLLVAALRILVALDDN
jgi:hypothetical protein